MQKRARLIYNPTSGRESFIHHLPDILKIYEQAGYETSTFQTTSEPFSAKKEAARCATVGFDLIIAAGGDGTLNEIVNGIAEKEFRPKVAVIPAGTTNDFARALHVPTRDFVAAAKVINKHRTVFMDIGKLKSHDTFYYFTNVAATGTLTELTYEVSPQMKTAFGYLAYLIKGLQMLPQVRNEQIRVTYDGQVYEQEVAMVLIALTTSIGGFENIAPDKVMGDGEFTLIIIQPSNLLEMAEIVRQLLESSNEQIHHPNLLYIKADEVKLEVLSGDRTMPVNLDGEYGGDLPAEFINLQQHIEFVADWEKFESVDTEEKRMMEAQIQAEIDSIEKEYKK
ncbi:diacylglycerol kinase [Allofustis seminis]|uniref:diacylglycerol kinase n=1 Tax=Allofustis seminis TaxID=166939 RepID=UPI00035C2570|nr:diacylglycerol kinase [Allofustis seminis]